MFSHILIPTDGSPLATIAMQSAMAFARDAGAKVTVLTVTPPFHLFAVSPHQVEASRSGYAEQEKTRAAHHLATAEQEARRLGVVCDSLHLEAEEPYRKIIDTAAERGCDLIAIGSHGRSGVTALMLGSVTQKVLAHTNLPVLVYRPQDVRSGVA